MYVELSVSPLTCWFGDKNFEEVCQKLFDKLILAESCICSIPPFSLTSHFLLDFQHNLHYF